MAKERGKARLRSLNLKRKPREGGVGVMTQFDDLSDKAKQGLIERGLNLKSTDGEKIQTIALDRISKPSIFGRLDGTDEHEDLTSCSTLDPILVAKVKGGNRYIIIDGSRRYDFLRHKEITEVRCRVVGIAECVSQVAMARAVRMTKSSKPMSVYELALGVLQLRRQLQLEFGEDAIFTHGGQRRGDGQRKIKARDYIAERLNLKPWAAVALLNFAVRLGPHALRALHNKPGLKEPSLTEIRDMNAEIKKRGLKEQMKERIDTSKRQKKTESVLLREAGGIAGQFINNWRKGRKAAPDPKRNKQSVPGAGRGARGEKTGSSHGKGRKRKTAIVSLDELAHLVSSHIQASKELKETLRDKKRFSQIDVKRLRVSMTKLEKSWESLRSCLDGLIGEDGIGVAA